MHLIRTYPQPRMGRPISYGQIKGISRWVGPHRFCRLRAGFLSDVALEGNVLVCRGAEDNVLVSRQDETVRSKAPALCPKFAKQHLRAGTLSKNVHMFQASVCQTRATQAVECEMAATS